MRMSKIGYAITQKLNSMASAGMMGGAELINRSTRIVASIALAWSMGIVEFGIAAAALVIHDIIRLMIQNGLGARIVVANDDELAETTTAVHRLNWFIGFAMAALQCALAWPVAVHFGEPQLAYAIAAMAVVHIVYPAAMVQVYLAQRAQRWKMMSGTIAAQCATDNLLTAVLALIGFGLWSVVIPKLIVAPLWVLWHRHSTSWKSTAVPTAETYRSLAGFSIQIFASEALSGLRHHADKLLVGAILGPAALGIYAFAANLARVSLMSLSNAMGAVILPRLRESMERGRLLECYRRSIVEMLAVIGPIAASIAVVAPWLIPLCFGEKWAPAVPVVVIIALATISHPIFVATSQMLRAQKRAGIELKISMISALSFLVFFSIGLGVSIELAALLAGFAQCVVAVAVFIAMQPRKDFDPKQAFPQGAAS